MLLRDAPLTLREFVTHEDLPLALVFREVFAFLTDRRDAVVFGAHAVNAYAHVERMTQDVDVLTTNAPRLAEDLRAYLAKRLHIAVRVREVVPGVGFRIDQLRDSRNRHLVDIRQASVLTEHVETDGIRIVEIVELIAMKVSSMTARHGREKGLSDQLDVHRLLNAFPHLRAEDGPVADRLRGMGAADSLESWRAIVRAPIEADDEEG